MDKTDRRLTLEGEIHSVVARVGDPPTGEAMVAMVNAIADAVEPLQRPPVPDDDTERMSIAEFRELGYLQELNRLCLHRWGLALEVIVCDDGSEDLGGVWDYRDDPEGMMYSPGIIDPAKIESIDQQRRRLLGVREDLFGPGGVQSADDDDRVSVAAIAVEIVDAVEAAVQDALGTNARGKLAEAAIRTIVERLIRTGR